MATSLFASRLASEGIYVHEIRPGVTLTDLTTPVREKYDALIAQGLFPISRWGTPEDVASAVSAFCGDSFYIPPATISTSTAAFTLGVYNSKTSAMQQTKERYETRSRT